MFNYLGYFTKENILIFFEKKINYNLIIFYDEEDDFILKYSKYFKDYLLIKIPKLIVNGKFIKTGFLIYETKLELKVSYLNSNSDLILAKLSNSNLSFKNCFIFSNIIKKDEGNDLIFFLSNIFGMNNKLLGIDFENLSENNIYFKGSFYHTFFLIFESKQELSFTKQDEFWEDYLGPYIITDAFDGGFRNISWQNPVQFYINNIQSLSFENIQKSIKYYPIKIISLKQDYSIVKLKMDFEKSIDLFYNDISIFSYQYAFIEKCNIHILFDCIRKLKKDRIKKNQNLFILCGDLSDIIYEYLNNNIKIRKIISFKNLTAINANLIVTPTSSIPIFTTNCLLAV